MNLKQTFLKARTSLNVKTNSIICPKLLNQKFYTKFSYTKKHPLRHYMNIIIDLINKRTIITFFFIVISVNMLFSSSAYSLETELQGLRGINVTEKALTIRDLWMLKNSNINLLRMVIHADHNRKSRTVADKDLIISKSRLEHIKQILHHSENLGIKVILDMHTWPGRGSGEFWESKELQSKYINVWKSLATKLQDYPALIGFDLMNEPNYLQQLFDSDERKRIYQTGDWDMPTEWRRTTKDYFSLMSKTANAILQITPNKTIFVEGLAFASSPRYFNLMEPIDVPIEKKNNICYSFHTYHPHAFNHAKLKNGAYITYPDHRYNKENMTKFVQPVLDFQNKHDVNCIFVGEFGVMASSEESGADIWLDDVMSIFETNNWIWTYWSLSIKGRNPYLCVKDNDPLNIMDKDKFYQCNNKRLATLQTYWDLNK